MGGVWAGSGHPCEEEFGVAEELVARNWSKFSPLTEWDMSMKCTGTCRVKWGVNKKDLFLLLTRKFVKLQLMPEPRFAHCEI